jgi:hypothetical protein
LCAPLRRFSKVLRHLSHLPAAPMTTRSRASHLSPDRPNEIRRSPLSRRAPFRLSPPLPSSPSQSHEDARPQLPLSLTPFLFDFGRRRVRGDNRARHARGRLSARHGGSGAGSGLFSTGFMAAATASWRADAGLLLPLKQMNWSNRRPPHLICVYSTVVP